MNDKKLSFLKNIESLLPVAIFALLVFIFKWTVADIIWGTWISSLLVGLLFLGFSIILDLYDFLTKKQPLLNLIIPFVVKPLGVYVYGFFHLFIAFLFSKFSFFSHEVEFQLGLKFILKILSIYWTDVVIMFYFTSLNVKQTVGLLKKNIDSGNSDTLYDDLGFVIFGSFFLNILMIVALMPVTVIIGFIFSENNQENPILAYLLVFLMIWINNKIRSKSFAYHENGNHITKR